MVHMFLHTFHTPGLSINSYFIGDTETKRALIIDPIREVDQYIDYAHKEGYAITAITETHVHADFVSGSKELKHRLEGKPKIYCSAMGGEEWTPKYTDIKVKNGDNIQFGKLRLQALHTPGHTPEHIIWICYDESRSNEVPCLAFTGDLLFVGSIGRPDILGGADTKKLSSELYESLFNRIKFLPDLLEIYPAHGAGSLCGKGLSPRPTSTLGYERLFNEFLVKKPLEQWTEEVLRDIPAVPINFIRIKKMNVEGPPLMLKEILLDEKPQLIIDVRKPEHFAKAHITGSLNIPLGITFSSWVSAVLGEDIPLGVIVEKNDQLVESAKNLHLIGFDKIVLQLIWDEENFRKTFSISSMPFLDVKTLVEKLGEDPPYILDVRTPCEWNSGHIKDAHHIELAKLKERIKEIPKDADIYVLCGGGYRASIAASLLKKLGYEHVSNICGGMGAWTEAHLPIEHEGEKA